MGGAWLSVEAIGCRWLVPIYRCVTRWSFLIALLTLLAGTVWVADRGAQTSYDAFGYDYQARRLSIRMRRAKRTETLHTLNGTAVAVGRTIIALLENGQQRDGSVQLPAALAAHGAPARLPAQVETR